MDKEVHTGQGFGYRNDDHGRNQKMQKKLAMLEEENIILKSNGYLHKGIRERVRLISKLSKEHNVKILCKVLKVAKSTYYSILNHKASSREIENNTLKSKIFTHRLILSILSGYVRTSAVPITHLCDSLLTSSSTLPCFQT